MKKKPNSKETMRNQAKRAPERGPIRDLEISGRARSIKGGLGKHIPPPC
jgi:hypothetical protein